LGGAIVNVGRVFSNPVGDAALFTHSDLFAVALHEIGHSLGMSMANLSFIAESNDGDIDVTTPQPFVGTTIPLAFNLFGVTSHFDPSILGESVMGGGHNVAARSVLSALDILANAQLSGFNSLNLNPTSIPEPSTFFLFGTGLVVLVALGRKTYQRSRRSPKCSIC
jgi:hypothetical protein